MPLPSLGKPLNLTANAFHGTQTAETLPHDPRQAGYDAMRKLLDERAAAQRNNFPKDTDWQLVQRFMGKAQTSVVRTALRGEEAGYFREAIARLAATLRTMPLTHEGKDGIAHIRYFAGGRASFHIMEHLRLASRPRQPFYA